MMRLPPKLFDALAALSLAAALLVVRLCDRNPIPPPSPPSPSPPIWKPWEEGPDTGRKTDGQADQREFLHYAATDKTESLMVLEVSELLRSKFMQKYLPDKAMEENLFSPTGDEVSVAFAKTGAKLRPADLKSVFAVARGESGPDGVVTPAVVIVVQGDFSTWDFPAIAKQMQQLFPTIGRSEENGCTILRTKFRPVQNVDMELFMTMIDCKYFVCATAKSELLDVNERWSQRKNRSRRLAAIDASFTDKREGLVLFSTTLRMTNMTDPNVFRLGLADAFGKLDRVTFKAFFTDSVRLELIARGKDLDAAKELRPTVQGWLKEGKIAMSGLSDREPKLRTFEDIFDKSELRFEKREISYRITLPRPLFEMTAEYSAKTFVEMFSAAK
jgi:hypothetical protein